ncbi:MAG: hypothetical protein ACR2FO_02950 [Actinomycetota bacterium]
MAEQAVPQVLSAWVRRSLEEVGAFATEEVLAAFQQAAGDPAEWESAKSDPAGLLRSKNIDVPQTLEIVFEDQAATGDKAARRCLRVSRNEPPPDPGAPPIIWTYDICLL